MLELDRDLKLFQLCGESIIKRMCQMPSEDGSSDRAFIMLSSDRLLRELVTWGNRAVMDATFKVCYLVIAVCMLVYFRYAPHSLNSCSL